MHIQRHLTWFALLALTLLGSHSLAGQTTAEIAGTIQDATGAFIPGAQVTLTNVDTGVERATASNERGYWAFTLLQPGNYEIVVRQDGFKPLNRRGIVLHIAEKAIVDLQLEVGAVTEEVTVTAGAPLLQTTNATQGQVINNQRIVDLPLNGRDYIQLALLSAGANVTPNARFGGFTASGMRADQNNFMLDGMDNNSMQRTGQGRQAETVKPSIDSIQEFKVLTNNFSAEYGRAAGGIVSVSMRSGTNELHGTVYEFLRNEELDAKNFFDSPTQPRAPFKRNQFGFALGGPIVRNRTFYFGDYEGTRIRESRTVNATIPTTLQTSGDFSELSDPIYDPATADTQGERTPFANNVIPAARFDRVGAVLAGLYPATNKPGLTQNFGANPPSIQDIDRWDGKIDHTVSDKDTIYGRFSYQRRWFPNAPTLPPPAYGGSSDPHSDFEHDGQNLMLAYNRVFTPTLIWSVRAGWNRIFTARTSPTDENLNSSLLQLPGVDQSNPGMGQFNPSGFQALGIGNFNPNLIGTQNRQLISDLTWVSGRHTLKFGINFQWLQHFLNNSQQAHGNFSFDASFTEGPGSNGSAIADMLLGGAKTAQTSNFIWENNRRPYYDFYVQDEWRVNQRLTLNMGLRYELHLPWVDKLNRIGNVNNDDFGNPVVVVATDSSRRDRALYNTDANNLAPRFGFAFRANTGTVVRGGYGIFIGNTVWKPLLMQNPPFHFKAQLQSSPDILQLPLQNGMPEGITTAENASRIGIESLDPNIRLPYSQQWNLAIQRELPGDMVFEVGYYANRTLKLMRQYDINQPPPGPGGKNGRRPQQLVFVPPVDAFITVARNRYTERTANANFHSFQTRIEKRLTHGLSLMASYMFSKTMGDGRGGGSAGGTANGNPQDPFNLRAEYSLADEHIPHRFVTNYVYELPFGRDRKFLSGAGGLVDGIFGGWSLAGILTLSSGSRVNVRVRGNPSNTSPADRPDVVGDWRLDSSQQSLDRWFDTSAFVANERFTFGNAGRNLLEGPGLVNYDFAVYKTFNFTERVRMQFRAEAFNFTNTPAFGDPNAQVGNNNFGRISSAGRPRNLQFGLKVIF